MLSDNDRQSLRNTYFKSRKFHRYFQYVLLESIDRKLLGENTRLQQTMQQTIIFCLECKTKQYRHVYSVLNDNLFNVYQLSVSKCQTSVDKLYVNIVYTHTISLTTISTTVPQYTFPNLYAFSTAVFLAFKNTNQALISYFTQQYQQVFNNNIISLFFNRNFSTL